MAASRNALRRGMTNPARRLGLRWKLLQDQPSSFTICRKKRLS
jgi:hypothetical protein